MRCLKFNYISNIGLIVGIASILFVLVTCLPSNQSFGLTLADSGILSNRRHDLLSSQTTTGQQSLNYTNLGKSLGCMDLNANSAHAIALAKFLGCTNISIRQKDISSINGSTSSAASAPAASIPSNSSATNNTTTTLSIPFNPKEGRRHDLLSSQTTTGQQSLNYTNLGKSLGCMDLNANSAHAIALAKVLNCNNNNKISR